MRNGDGLLAWRMRELSRRVAALEAPPAPPKDKPKGKDAWDRLQVLMPLVNGIVLALVAWWVSGAVEYALKRDTLQLAQAKEMQALIAGLAGDNVDAQSATSAALTLAAYGRPAVGPLLSLLSERYDEVRGPAVESALRAVGIVQPDAVCTPLSTLLRSRSTRLGWPAKATLIRLLGDVQCMQARLQLEALRQRLGGGAVVDLAREFAPQPTFDGVATKELLKALDESLRSLESGK